jgi:hypothetical protein
MNDSAVTLRSNRCMKRGGGPSNVDAKAAGARGRRQSIRGVRF